MHVASNWCPCGLPACTRPGRAASPSAFVLLIDAASYERGSISMSTEYVACWFLTRTVEPGQPAGVAVCSWAGDGEEPSGQLPACVRPFLGDIVQPAECSLHSLPPHYRLLYDTCRQHSSASQADKGGSRCSGGWTMAMAAAQALRASHRLTCAAEGLCAACCLLPHR